MGGETGADVRGALHLTQYTPWEPYQRAVPGSRTKEPYLAAVPESRSCPATRTPRGNVSRCPQKRSPSKRRSRATEPRKTATKAKERALSAWRSQAQVSAVCVKSGDAITSELGRFEDHAQNGAARAFHGNATAALYLTQVLPRHVHAPVSSRFGFGP